MIDDVSENPQCQKYFFLIKKQLIFSLGQCADVFVFFPGRNQDSAIKGSAAADTAAATSATPAAIAALAFQQNSWWVIVVTCYER